MEINTSLVKELREKTGAGVMDCKKALEESKGDLSQALDYLRRKGLQTSSKKAGRLTREGLISSYIHPGGKIGVLIEVNCETDFVAKTDEFAELVKNLTLHIAALNPFYIKIEDVPPKILEKEKEIYKTQALNAGKPEKALDKIIQGKLEKYLSEICLLEQPYVRDPEITVKDLLNSVIAKLGENISIRRFIRYQLGEELNDL